jgi:hypothetical protein
VTRLIVRELNGFDNLYYEVCNEPYFGGVTPAWQNHIAEVIGEAEKGLPAKHLISMNIANGRSRVKVETAAGMYPMRGTSAGLRTPERVTATAPVFRIPK